VEKDVVLAREGTCMPSSSSESEGVANWDSSEEVEEEEAETVKSEGGEEGGEQGERRRRDFFLRAPARTLRKFWSLWCRGFQLATIKKKTFGFIMPGQQWVNHDKSFPFRTSTSTTLTVYVIVLVCIFQVHFTAVSSCQILPATLKARIWRDISIAPDFTMMSS